MSSLIQQKCLPSQPHRPFIHLAYILQSIINTNSRRITGTVSLEEQETAKKRKEKKWVNWTAGKQEKGEVGDLGESQAAAAAGLKTLWCDED